MTPLGEKPEKEKVQGLLTIIMALSQALDDAQKRLRGAGMLGSDELSSTTIIKAAEKLQ